jgi:hypothetical protein
MSITANAKTFTADSYKADAVGYLGPAHTLSVKDDLWLRRQLRKATATFSGLSRTQFKLIRTYTLTGALTSTADGFIEINVAVPFGTADASVDALLNDAGAWLSGADAKTHVKGQKISY